MLFIHLVIALPDILELLLGDTLAGIGDGHPHVAVMDGLLQGDGLVLSRIGDGIVHQVVHHLGDLQLVSLHPNLLLRMEGEPVIRQFIIAVQHLADALRQVKGALLQGQDTCLQLGQVQQVVDQVGQALRLVNDDLDVLRGVLAGQVPHHFAISLNHGQGCAQIMGDIGQQIPPQTLHLGQLPGGVIQGLGQLPDLFGSMLLKADGIIPGCQHLGPLINGSDGPGNFPGDHHGQQSAQHHHHDHQGGHLHQQRLLDGVHRGDDALQQHHAIEPRGRTSDGDIEDHRVLRAVLIHKGGPGHNHLGAPLQVHFVEQVVHVCARAGEILQIALLLTGLPPRQQLAHLIGDHNVDAGIQAELAHLLCHILIVQPVLHTFGSGFHPVDLHRPVKGVQQHHLEQPQQRCHHHNQHPKAQHNLPADAQGSPLAPAHLKAPQIGNLRHEG